MWNWFNLNAFFADVKVIKDELSAAQAKVTELTNGALTLETEIAILRYALIAAGIKIPVTLNPTQQQIAKSGTPIAIPSGASPYDASIKRL